MTAVLCSVRKKLVLEKVVKGAKAAQDGWTVTVGDLDPSQGRIRLVFDAPEADRGRLEGLPAALRVFAGEGGEFAHVGTIRTLEGAPSLDAVFPVQSDGGGAALERIEVVLLVHREEKVVPFEFRNVAIR